MIKTNSVKPKVKTDVESIDFTNDLPQLFNKPLVEHKRTFKNLTSDFIVWEHSGK